MEEVAPMEDRQDLSSQESAGEEGVPSAKVPKVQCGKCGHSFVGVFRYRQVF